MLADGKVGPEVGRLAADGSVVLDEVAWAGEWVSELLTATMPRTRDGRPPDGAPVVPDEVRSALARGRAAEWRGAMDASLVAACRSEVASLDTDGALESSNHGQDRSIRGDRVAHLALDGHRREEEDEEDDEEEADDEHERCPVHLRRLFTALEEIGSQVADSLGCGPLLTPRLGMVATYDGAHGYVRHLDNERDETNVQASGYRNFRVLTAIAYLNDEDWAREDGGLLRCYDSQTSFARTDVCDPPPTGAEACELEVVPRGGTVVVFPSCLVPHEVTPARRARCAATLWFVSSSLLQPLQLNRHAAPPALTVPHLEPRDEDRSTLREERAIGPGGGARASGGRPASRKTPTYWCGGAEALFGASSTVAKPLVAHPQAGSSSADDSHSAAPGASPAPAACEFAFNF
jgi:hypothetical protein